MHKLGLYVLMALCAVCTNAHAKISLQNLRCEMLQNPEGIDITKPRLSWEIVSDARAVEQTNYQVIVSSSLEKLAANEGDLWDSQKLGFSNSIHVAYNGKNLKSRTECYWKVKVWTSKGESDWSEPAHWSMGLINYVDWKGRWIGLDKLSTWDKEVLNARLSARYFRKEFAAKAAVKKAKVYIMGLGLYELFINGKRVGDQVLAPVPTDYGKGIKYNTYDVTNLVNTGNNAIATTLGNGRFYAMRQSVKPYKIKTFGYPKMLLQLELEYTDGKRETIITDDTWKVTADGPIRTNNEYDGEEYDATKEMTGWNSVGFKEENWMKAPLVQEPGGNFEAQMSEPMKVMQVVKPITIKQLNTSSYVLDMGQNMAGWLQLKVKGKRGGKITLRFAETLQKDGSLYVANLRDAKATDVYTVAGNGQEVWEPRFVYHGFRYVEVSGYPGTPTINDFEGKVVYDNMRATGTFESSNKTLNQIFKNAWWGINSNYKGMPVDCPQRNERQPWLGDRTTGSYGESFLFDNSKLYAKWLDDIEQSQKADGSIPDVAPAFWRYYGDDVTWPGTYITVADMLYRQYANTGPIIKHYPSMKKWVDYMQDKYMQNNLIAKDRYGDWCVPPESPEMIHSQDPKRNTDGELIASSNYVYLLGLMQRFALVVDKPGDALEYKQLASDITVAFNRKFFNDGTALYSNNSVTSNLLPLSFNMVPKQMEAKVFENIVDKILVENKGHISTGVIGTQWLMRGLTQHGRADIAYKIATNTTYPSWGYMAANGATTIWELWNGNTADPAMNSGNHVMLLGDLLVWYFENLAGIKSDTADAGFKTIIMKPSFVDWLDFVKASYKSIYGDIKSEWKKASDNFTWKITVPANSKALVYIPASSEKVIKESNQPAINAEGVKFIKSVDGMTLLEVGSGEFTFSVDK
jgi:alpha-L-rhamnosidase